MGDPTWSEADERAARDLATTTWEAIESSSGASRSALIAIIRDALRAWTRGRATAERARVAGEREAAWTAGAEAMRAEIAQVLNKHEPFGMGVWVHPGDRPWRTDVERREWMNPADYVAEIPPPAYPGDKDGGR